MLENPVMAMGYVRSGNVWNEYELTENDVALTIQPHEDDTRLKFKKGYRVDVFNSQNPQSKCFLSYLSLVLIRWQRYKE